MPLTALWMALVLNVHDGDTFTATVNTWVNEAVTARIRIAGIDTPEIGGRAHCPQEAALAVTARQALVSLLGGEFVFLSHLRPDKYGRTDATVQTRAGLDVGKELLKRKLAVKYNGRGPKHDFCTAGGH